MNPGLGMPGRNNAAAQQHHPPALLAETHQPSLMDTGAAVLVVGRYLARVAEIAARVRPERLVKHYLLLLQWQKPDGGICRAPCMQRIEFFCSSRLGAAWPGQAGRCWPCSHHSPAWTPGCSMSWPVPAGCMDSLQRQGLWTQQLLQTLCLTIAKCVCEVSAGLARVPRRRRAIDELHPAAMVALLFVGGMKYCDDGNK